MKGPINIGSLALPSASRSSWFRIARELVLMVGLFVLYSQIRYLTRDDTTQAMSNARSVVRLERSVGAFLEPAIQDAAIRFDGVVAFLNRYYVGVHFPLTALFIVWVLVRHSDWYRPIRTWLIGVTAAGLAIHVAFPLAPPRMLPHEGFIDTLRVFGPNIYPADTTQSVANQFAAMPSLHFGWSVIVAGGVIAIMRTRWSLLALIHPLLTLLAIVATANHYLLDAFVAGVLCAAIAPLAGMLRSPTRAVEPVTASNEIESYDAASPTRPPVPCRPAAAPARPVLANADSSRRHHPARKPAIQRASVDC